MKLKHNLQVGDKIKYYKDVKSGLNKKKRVQEYRAVVTGVYEHYMTIDLGEYRESVNYADIKDGTVKIIRLVKGRSRHEQLTV